MDGRENNSQIWKRRVMQRSAGDQVSFRCTAWSTDSSVQTVVVQIQIRPTSHRGIFWRCLKNCASSKPTHSTGLVLRYFCTNLLPFQTYWSIVQISYVHMHIKLKKIPWWFFIWNPRLERAEAEDGSSYWAATTVGGGWGVGAVKVSVKGFSR